MAVIAALGSQPAAIAAKAATTTIPIVFAVAENPVKLGLVASLARPGGNATGINYFGTEVATKRLALLHALVPKAVRIAVLVNPANNTAAETTLREVQEAARTIGLQIQVLNASTRGEIDAAFATLARTPPDALFVATDGFLTSRGVQFTTLAARDRIPAAYADRETVAAGGLMSYGTDARDAYRQAGVYTGNILKGAKPQDLPVVQSTNFDFAINLQTAKLLGIEVPWRRGAIFGAPRTAGRPTASKRLRKPDGWPGGWPNPARMMRLRSPSAGLRLPMSPETWKEAER